MELPNGWSIAPNSICDEIDEEDYFLADVEQWNGYEIFNFEGFGVFTFKNGDPVVCVTPGFDGADDAETIAQVISEVQKYLAAKEGELLQIPLDLAL